jgi:hypothetical protein
MVPAGNAVFVNAASNATIVAVRPENGQWNNDFRLDSKQNREYTFGTARFEIVLDAQPTTGRVQKIMDCGDTYVIYYDFPGNRWDIMKAADYK